MSRLRGSSLIMSAVILIVLGVVLRWDLIDWLIDITGFFLIAIGIILGII